MIGINSVISPVYEEPEPLVHRIDPREIQNRRQVTSRSVGNFGKYIATSQSLQSNYPFSSNDFTEPRSGKDVTLADSVNTAQSRSNMIAIHEHAGNSKLKENALSEGD